MTWLKPGQGDRADQAARVGLLIGAAAGMVMFFASNREFVMAARRHGPGMVRGRDVVEGGWATERDITKIAEFGPPRRKTFGGGIVMGRLNGRILRVLPEKGKIKMAGHVILIGATGIGKSYTYIRNNIIAAVCAGESIVVTDPSGEFYPEGTCCPPVGQGLRYDSVRAWHPSIPPIRAAHPACYKQIAVAAFLKAWHQLPLIREAHLPLLLG